MKDRLISLGEKKFFWLVALTLAFLSLLIEFTLKKRGLSILNTSRGLLLTTTICTLAPIFLWKFLNRRKK